MQTFIHLAAMWNLLCSFLLAFTFQLFLPHTSLFFYVISSLLFHLSYVPSCFQTFKLQCLVFISTSSKVLVSVMNSLYTSFDRPQNLVHYCIYPQTIHCSILNTLIQLTSFSRCSSVFDSCFCHIWILLSKMSAPCAVRLLLLSGLNLDLVSHLPSLLWFMLLPCKWSVDQIIAS